MRDVLGELLSLLRLERIEDRIFRGQSQNLGWGAVFGGQVLGQALSAAAQTVPADRHVHSLHAYFLRQGDARFPIVYEVDPSRDGTSFTTRRVVAIQNGQPIFILSSSFQGDEPGYDHAAPILLDVPGPEGLLSEQEAALRVIDQIPEPLRAQAVADRPIEIRAVQPWSLLRPKKMPPRRQLWYRASAPLPDDPAVHRYLLAYASDFNFLPTAMMPHGVSWLTPGMQVASLDHAMWFHRPFRFDDWLLYDVESPSASGARGLVLGRFYARDGTLVASTAQEGLMRNRELPK
ncbi:acyl-CoA thioesterase II [Deltaproteobacteria bacterium]|nr:acyl-CoA thioesterase II [Deltaproteobacteria bacterium]